MKAAAALALAMLAAGPAPQVLATELVVTDTATGELSRIRRTVPYRPGRSCYDWRVTVTPEQRVVELTETLTLPAPAPQWNSDDPGATAVAADRKSAVSRIVEDMADGTLTHGWCVANGDPSGPYRIEVRADGAVIATFDFTVLPPADAI